MKLLRSRFLFVLLVCSVLTSLVRAQSDDFNTWTNFKVNHKIDSRFSVSGGVELRTEDNLNALDRWGVVVGGGYRACPFLDLSVGYETHYRNLGEEGWKFRHRYHLGATFNTRYHWLKVSLRERFQQTFDRGDTESVLRSRLKLAYAPSRGIVSPYFSLELYQSLDDDAPFWRAKRMRYRPGVELTVAKVWKLDIFYCYEHRRHGTGKNIAGVECTFSF